MRFAYWGIGVDCNDTKRAQPTWTRSLEHTLFVVAHHLYSPLHVVVALVLPSHGALLQLVLRDVHTGAD
jgi:hypothetical protein